MEVDTESALSLISRSTIKWLVPCLAKDTLTPIISTSKIIRRTVSQLWASSDFECLSKKIVGPLRLVVIERPCPSLLGLDWFVFLGLGINGINHITNPDVWIIEFPDVIDGTLGQYAGTLILFILDPQIAPICLKLCWVPFTLKPKVDEQPDKLIVQGVLEPVDHAKW